jgi:hypothetical protein
MVRDAHVWIKSHATHCVHELLLSYHNLDGPFDKLSGTHGFWPWKMGLSAMFFSAYVTFFFMNSLKA